MSFLWDSMSDRVKYNVAQYVGSLGMAGWGPWTCLKLKYWKFAIEMRQFCFLYFGPYLTSLPGLPHIPRKVEVLCLMIPPADYLKLKPKLTNHQCHQYGLCSLRLDLRPCESQELVTRLARSLRPRSLEMAVMAGTTSTRETRGSVREESRDRGGSSGLGRLTTAYPRQSHNLTAAL